MNGKRNNVLYNLLLIIFIHHELRKVFSMNHRSASFNG